MAWAHFRLGVLPTDGKHPRFCSYEHANMPLFDSDLHAIEEFKGQVGNVCVKPELEF